MSEKNGGSGGKNGIQVHAQDGIAAGQSIVTAVGNNIRIVLASPARSTLVAVTLFAVIYGLTVQLMREDAADRRDDAAPVAPTTARSEPHRTSGTGAPTGPSSTAADVSPLASASPSHAPAPKDSSSADRSAPLRDCRSVGKGGVKLTPSDLQVRERGELSAHVNCETKDGEHLYYMVRIDNIMESRMPEKTGYYLKGELSARNASEQIKVDLWTAEPGSIRYGFVQLLRDDEYAKLKKESKENNGVIAALPQSSVTVSGEARVTRIA